VEASLTLIDPQRNSTKGLPEKPEKEIALNKPEKSRDRAGVADARLAVRRHMFRLTAVRLAVPAVRGPGACSTIMLPCCTIVCSSVLLLPAVRALSDLCFFLEIASKIFLSIKTRKFLLKVRQNILEA